MNDKTKETITDACDFSRKYAREVCNGGIGFERLINAVEDLTDDMTDAELPRRQRSAVGKLAGMLHRANQRAYRAGVLLSMARQAATEFLETGDIVDAPELDAAGITVPRVIIRKFARYANIREIYVDGVYHGAIHLNDGHWQPIITNPSGVGYQFSAYSSLNDAENMVRQKYDEARADGAAKR